MRATPTSFWAKLCRDPAAGIVEWHSVEHHCADVAACFEMLLNQPVIVARRRDLPSSDPRTAGHVAEVCALLAAQNEHSARLGSAIAVDRLIRWFETEDTLYEFLLASLSHHGRPHGASGPYHPRLWSPSNGLDPFDGIAALARRTVEWFPHAYVNGGTPLPSPPELQHAFCGLLTLADWLGSDESFFPFSEQADADRMPFARARAAQLAREIGINAAPARSALGHDPIRMEKIGEYTPRALQSAMLDLPLVRIGLPRARGDRPEAGKAPVLPGPLGPLGPLSCPSGTEGLATVVEA